MTVVSQTFYQHGGAIWVWVWAKNLGRKVLGVFSGAEIDNKQKSEGNCSVGNRGYSASVNRTHSFVLWAGGMDSWRIWSRIQNFWRISLSNRRHGFGYCWDTVPVNRTRDIRRPRKSSKRSIVARRSSMTTIESWSTTRTKMARAVTQVLAWVIPRKLPFFLWVHWSKLILLIHVYSKEHCCARILWR